MSILSTTSARARSWPVPGLGYESASIAALALVVALWLGFDVSAGDIALFLAYELGFLLVPGWLAYVAIAGRRHRPLREISIGWALGHLLEIGAFSITAALDSRGLLAVYPVLVAGASLLAIRLQRIRLRPLARSEVDVLRTHRVAWVVAGVIGLAAVYTALLNLAQLPLPGPAGFRGWFLDWAFHLDVTAEALHHWPIASPEVAGVGLPYQNFVYMHMAAIAQITGISLPVVVLRLTMLPLLILGVLEMTWAGEALTGLKWSGPLAAGLLLLVGEVNLTPKELASKFEFLGSTLSSTTVLLGLVLFIPIVVLLSELIGAAPAHGDRRRGWFVLAVLLVGCAGSKGSILPVLGAGLVVYLIVVAVRERRLDRGAGVGLGLVGAAFIATYPLFYGGHNEGLVFNFDGIASQSRSIVSVARLLGPIPGATGTFYVFANILLVVAFAAAPLAGVIWLVRDRAYRSCPTTWLLGGLFLASLGPFFFMTAPGTSTVWFTYYGFAAATLLSAQGLCLFWRAWGRRPAVGRLLVKALAWGAAICLTSYLVFRAGLDTAFQPLVWLGTTAALIAAGWLVRSSVRHAGRLGLAVRLMLPVLVAGAIDLPMHFAPETAEIGGEPLYANDWGYVPGGLVAGLDWLRSHSNPDQVLAVNNYDLRGPPASPGIEPAYMYYSALAQRRVFLEGWIETSAVVAGDAANPFPAGRRLNDAVFQRADPRALQTLRTRYRVAYLVVDKANGPAGPSLTGVARLVYANPDVDIYSTTREAASDPSRGPDATSFAREG